MLDEYHRSGNPGGFRVIQTGGTFLVIPSEARNLQGLPEQTLSLLETTISVGASDGTALQMLDSILEAVSRKTGSKTWLGSGPTNLLVQTAIHGTPTNASARAILLRVLEATGRRLSWRLLCAPGPVRDCALNVYEVK